MKKLLFAGVFLALCAVLEAPGDYEWTPGDAKAAILAEHAAGNRICTEPAENVIMATAPLPL